MKDISTVTVQKWHFCHLMILLIPSWFFSKLSNTRYSKLSPFLPVPIHSFLAEYLTPTTLLRRQKTPGSFYSCLFTWKWKHLLDPHSAPNTTTIIVSSPHPPELQHSYISITFSYLPLYRLQLYIDCPYPEGKITLVDSVWKPVSFFSLHLPPTF